MVGMCMVGYKISNVTSNTSVGPDFHRTMPRGMTSESKEFAHDRAAITVDMLKLERTSHPMYVGIYMYR